MGIAIYREVLMLMQWDNELSCLSVKISNLKTNETLYFFSESFKDFRYFELDYR